MRSERVLKFFVVLLIAVFFVHQASAAVYKPISTESASYYTAADGLNITGLIIRNETLVKSQSGGVMHFIASDGDRVAKNGIIANIYDNETASITLSRMDSVNAKIADIEEMMSYNDLEAADLDMINTRVQKSLDSMIISVSGGDFDNYSDCREALLSALNRRQIAMGETADFSSQLAALKSELASLSSSLLAAKGTIRAEKSGYFVSKTDGYEQTLTADILDALTPEKLDSVKSAQTPADVIGKIVSDYEWYIAARVSINESLKYKEGDSLTVYTSVKSYPQMPVTLKKINISESSSSAVLIFECSDMNSELASMRTGPMTVVKKEYSGL